MICLNKITIIFMLKFVFPKIGPTTYMKLILYTVFEMHLQPRVQDKKAKYEISIPVVHKIVPTEHNPAIRIVFLGYKVHITCRVPEI